MKKAAIIVTLFVLAVLLMSCMPPPGTEIEYNETDAGALRITHAVNRVIDYEAQVVCYTHRDNYAGGIDCMPLSETALPRE